MVSKSDLPRSRDLIWPIVRILKNSGGRASKPDIDTGIAELLVLSDEVTKFPHDKSRTELQYRSAWALSYGKRAGYFENPGRNQWALSESGERLTAASDVRI